MGWFERAGNLVTGLRARSTHEARTRWSRDQLAAYQREQLTALVHFASRHSPFYRDLYGGEIDGPVDRAQLPIVTKSAMMSNFDRVVTDPRIRLADVLLHVEQLRDDELYLDGLRVMASSGSSGQKAIFIYDRDAWRGGFMATGLRMASFTGLAPRLPRVRIATVAAGDGKHMTFRGGASMDVGLYAARRFQASSPLPELVTALERHRPDFILGYPSVLAILADEQRAGRMRIAPRIVVTSSEMCTDAMATSIREAWGSTPFNCLGMTETGIVAMDCAEHAGMHVFEDLAILEAVDDENRPVPIRTQGAKILVTNLYNRRQPIIRFEVSDLVTLDDAPCACGRSLQRIVAIDGRSDDILELPGPNGIVRVHPIHLRGPLGADSGVLQYQVVHTPNALDVHVVLTGDAPASTAPRLATALRTALGDRGVDFPVHVQAVKAIAREPGPGKLKLVRRASAPS